MINLIIRDIVFPPFSQEKQSQKKQYRMHREYKHHPEMCSASELISFSHTHRKIKHALKVPVTTETMRPSVLPPCTIDPSMLSIALELHC